MTTFIRRVFGALGLDPATFEDVEADRSATGQAVLVVLLASIGAGLGNTDLGSSAPRIIVVAAAASILAWATWAGLIYYLGTRVLPDRDTRADFGEVFRTLGFAAAPGMFRAFEVFGNTRWFVLPLTSLWMIVAMTIGVRQALDYRTTTRAVALALLGWGVAMGMAIVVGTLLSTPVS
ncbi:MAG: YIP1 family protein [Acidobacteriota bacterium]